MDNFNIFRFLKNLLNRILSIFDLKIERKSISLNNYRQQKVGSTLIQFLTSPEGNLKKDQNECIVFSMDRAMQLHALLGSYLHHVKDPAPIHLLYRASNDVHHRAYLEELEEFKLIILSVSLQDSKKTFRKQLLEILRNIHSNKLFFLVDDNVFIEKTDLSLFATIDSKFLIPSLRLGANLKRSYTVNKDQPLPPFYSNSMHQNFENTVPVLNLPAEKDELVYWFWKEGSFDWAYPLSVDGHMFNTSEILCLAENTEFNSPNTFESNLQQYNDFFKHRLGVCHKKSRLINVPCNRIQSDYENLHGSLHQEDLLKLWNSGKRIDFLALQNYQNISAHEDLSLNFIDRIH